MTKIAGIKRRSPETYDNVTVVQGFKATFESPDAGPTAIDTSDPGNDLVPPISFDAAAGDRAIVLFSATIQSALPGAGQANIRVVVEPGTEIRFNMVTQVGVGKGVPPLSEGSSRPIGLSFETEFAAGTHTISVKGNTLSPTTSAEVVDASMVVMITNA